MKKLLIIISLFLSSVLINTANVYADGSCFIDGNYIVNGKTIELYKYKISNNCDGNRGTRQCVNGILNGNNDYSYFNCTDDENNYIQPSNNLDIGAKSSGNNIINRYLNKLGGNSDIKVGNQGEKSIVEFLYNIAKDIKTVFYILSGVYFMILVIKLILTENTDEEVGNFKKGVIWITIGIVFMQISFYFITVLYAKEIGGALATSLIENIIEPIIKILETAASFFFLLVAIYAFYRIITANGDEEKVKTGKMTILYGIIGFIVIKLSKDLVYASYGKIECNTTNVLGIFQIGGNKCITDSQISGISQIVVNIINWANSFIGIVVILMIIYAGIQVLFSAGDEEKLSKAKKSIIYITIGIAILVLNYFILSFFIRPEITI